MREWLLQYWWVLLGVGLSSLYVFWRMQDDDVKGTVFRRFLFALFPVLNPESPEHKQITPRALWLALAGLALVALVNLLAYLFAVS